MHVLPPRAVRWTRDEYCKLHEAGFFADRRVELIQGEVIEKGPQESLHATAIVLLDNAMRSVFGEGFVVRTQLPLSLGSDSDPEPDLAVVAGRPRDHRTTHPASAVLVVEAAGPSLEHDRTRKAEVYAAAGIEDYWILDLIHRRLEVLRGPGAATPAFGPAGYASRTVLDETQSASPLAAPGASIRVADLLP